MEFWYFTRHYYEDAQAIAHLPGHPFEAFKAFKEKQAETELFFKRGPDHIESRSLDAARDKAEDYVRSLGTDDLLMSEPEIIPLPENRPPFSTPNFAFAWKDSGGGGFLIVPLRFSSELAKIERHQLRQGVPRRSLFDGTPKV